jgi:hypothetical protein
MADVEEMKACEMCGHVVHRSTCLEGCSDGSGHPVQCGCIYLKGCEDHGDARTWGPETIAKLPADASPSEPPKCPQCGGAKDDPREDSIERMLVCGASFHLVSPSEPQEQKAENIDVYEVEDKSGGYDYTVIRHDAREAVLDTIWDRLDALEDGETLTITYRKYTQEQMDEVYDHD